MCAVREECISSGKCVWNSSISRPTFFSLGWGDKKGREGAGMSALFSDGIEEEKVDFTEKKK